MDYVNLLTKAERLNLTPTAYARQMVVNGYVRAPYTDEHLELLRKIAGEANNINQITKHLNAGQGSYKLYALAIVEKLKKIIAKNIKSQPFGGSIGYVLKK